MKNFEQESTQTMEREKGVFLCFLCSLLFKNPFSFFWSRHRERGAVRGERVKFRVGRGKTPPDFRCGEWFQVRKWKHIRGNGQRIRVRLHG
jgi:hypothetical protein